MISTPELIRTQILALVKEYHTARYSLLQIILIIFVTVLAVIVTIMKPRTGRVSVITSTLTI